MTRLLLSLLILSLTVTAEVNRLLVVGDSITRHDPAESLGLVTALKSKHNSLMVRTGVRSPEGNDPYPAAPWAVIDPCLAAKPVKEAKLLTGIVPEPQKVYQFAVSRLPFMISSKTVVVLEKNSVPMLKQAVTLLQKDFQILYGLNVPVVEARLEVNKNVLMLCDSRADFKKLAAQSRGQVAKLLVKGDESYRLMADTKVIVIDSPAATGVFYGVQTLRQMLREDRSVPALLISDWPDQAIRACYLGMPTDAMIDRLARLKINMCIVESRWYGGGNWWYNPTGKNREEATRFFKLCRENNIEPVPLVQGLGWAYGVVDANPNCGEGLWVRDEKVSLTAEHPVELKFPNVIQTKSAPIVVTSGDKKATYREDVDYKIMPGPTGRPFDETNPRWKLARIAAGQIHAGQEVLVSYNYMTQSRLQSPYCPSEPLTYEIVDRVLKDVIQLYKPRYIHIGHDEVIYANRCSRCVGRKLSTPELLGQDIRHWYDYIHACDATVKVMMWDDLLRENHPGGSLMPDLPGDIIIFPWVYEVKPEEIQQRVDWFVLKNKNPVVGAASGYFHDNIWLWKEMAGKFVDRPNFTGFAYTHWGESFRLYSALSFAAEYMWSRNKPVKGIFDLYAQADVACRDLELGLTLSLAEQTEALARTVDLTSLSKEGGAENINKLTANLTSAREKIKPYILPEMAMSTIAMGTVPERALSQMDAVCEYFRMMQLYAQAVNAYGGNDQKKTLALLTEISHGFIRWHFPGYENARDWLTTYDKTKKVPTFKDIFGFEAKE